MFSAIKDFLYRHQNKIVLGSAAAGSAFLVSQYAQKRSSLLVTTETNDAVVKEKKKQHYEKLLRTSKETVLSLSQTLTKIVLERLDTDSVLQAIRLNPEDKQKLWHELKVLAFARCVAAVYSAALVVPVVHCQLMVLGGYSFQNISTSDLNGQVDSETQENYLLCVKKFIESGIPTLLERIIETTQNIVEEVQLDSELSMERVEATLKDISIALQEQNPIVGGPVFNFDQFFTDDREEQDSMVRKMQEETEDVLTGLDFVRVLEILIQCGFNHVLDRICEQYPRCVSTGTSPVPQDENPATMPLAKLIPMLNAIAGPSLSPAPGQLLPNLCLNDYIEAFSFNIYESFSSDVQQAT